MNRFWQKQTNRIIIEAQLINKFFVYDLSLSPFRKYDHFGAFAIAKLTDGAWILVLNTNRSFYYVLASKANERNWEETMIFVRFRYDQNERQLITRKRKKNILRE